jgi:hypothetical protein
MNSRKAKEFDGGLRESQHTRVVLRMVRLGSYLLLALVGGRGAAFGRFVRSTVSFFSVPGFATVPGFALCLALHLPCVGVVNRTACCACRLSVSFDVLDLRRLPWRVCGLRLTSLSACRPRAPSSTSDWSFVIGCTRERQLGPHRRIVKHNPIAILSLCFWVITFSSSDLLP